MDMGSNALLALHQMDLKVKYGRAAMKVHDDNKGLQQCILMYRKFILFKPIS